MLGCLTALPKHVHSLNSIMEYIFSLNTYHVLATAVMKINTALTQSTYYRLPVTPRIVRHLNLVFFCVKTW